MTAEPRTSKSNGELPTRSMASQPISPNWAHDVIVVGSISLTAIAASILLRAHLDLSLNQALPISVSIFCLLTAAHVLFRRTLIGSSGAQSQQTARSAKNNSGLASVPVDMALPASGAAPIAADQLEPVLSDVQGTKTVVEHTKPGSRSQPVLATDTETLQQLIADLARTVPGPKATTPDPDRHLYRRIEPNFEPAAGIDIERTLDAEAKALHAMANAMAGPSASVPSFARIVEDAINSEHIATYLEPIQALDQQRARHFEVSIRLRAPDGTELIHDEVMMAARSNGLIPRLDAAKIPRAVRIASHLAGRGRGADILSTIEALSITDTAFQSKIAEVLNTRDTSHLVLSFTQDDVRDFVPVHWQALRAMSGYGVRFAIEDVFDLDMDFEALKANGFDFIKIDANILLAGLPSPSGLISPEDLCRYLSALGLAIVVARLDDEDTLARVMGFGVLMGQGTLFGGKRTVKAEILGQRDAA